jgi:hypothetical protein
MPEPRALPGATFRAVLCAALWMIPLLLSACGYGFGPQRADFVLPEDRRALFIIEVDNPTTESWLEPTLRADLRDELTRRGHISWTDRNRATALVRVTIESYSRPRALTGKEETTVYRNASIKVNMRIVDPVDNTAIWSSGSVQAQYPFLQGDEREADETVVKLAVRQLADRMNESY